MNTESTRSAWRAVLAALLLSVAPASAYAQRYTGSLGPGDPKMEDNSYYDTYYVEAQSGQEIDVLLTSTDFDSYLHLYAPSGRREATLFSGRLPAGELRLPAEGLRPGSLLLLGSEDGRRLLTLP